MFRNCESKEECLRLLWKLKPLLESEPDSLHVLRECFEEYIKEFDKQESSDTSRILPGKYQLTKLAKIDGDNSICNELIEDLLEYYRKNPVNRDEYEPNFLASVAKQTELNGYITAKQYNVLVGFYYRNNVEVSRD